MAESNVQQTIRVAPATKQMVDEMACKEVRSISAVYEMAILDKYMREEK